MRGPERRGGGGGRTAHLPSPMGCAFTSDCLGLPYLLCRAMAASHSSHIVNPLCDIPSGCCFFTGPWTVTRSSLRMLRRVAAFCRPLRLVLLRVSFPHLRSPVVGTPGVVLERGAEAGGGSETQRFVHRKGPKIFALSQIQFCPRGFC